MGKIAQEWSVKVYVHIRELTMWSQMKAVLYLDRYLIGIARVVMCKTSPLSSSATVPHTRLLPSGVTKS